MKNEVRGLSNWLAIILIIITLVGVSVAYIVYTQQQAKITDLNNQLSSLQKKANTPCPTLIQQPNMILTCPDYSFKSSKGINAIIYSPAKNAIVTSPVAIIGEIPGNWSFEAQFPVKLIDSQGNVISKAAANVLGDWQTTNPTPFSVQLTYPGQPYGVGTIVLQKDNPSGLPANDDSISIPIHF